MTAARLLLVRLAGIGALGVALSLLLGSAVGSTVTAGARTSAATLVAAPTTAPSAAPGGITVDGAGIVIVTPDEATVGLGVQTQASTAVRTQADASAAMTRIIVAIEALGIASADIATQSISLSPVYDNGPQAANPPKVTGYQASQSVAITVRRLAQTGAVIDAGVAAGATSVDGVTFSVADGAAASTQARTAAFNDAKQRAQTLAQAAGVTLGPAISITEVSAPNVVPFAVPGPAGAVSTPVQPGTTQVEVDVEVTFAIGS
jgi:uncharacterized protein YggE